MESRRPVGLELLATGPTYRTISVDATLDVAPTASLTGVQTAIGEALDTALSPLHWQFGLDFRPVVLLVAIQRVDGVLGVARFALAVAGTPVNDPPDPVRLAPTDAVAPGEHTLLIRPC